MNTRVTVERQLYPSGPFELVASYGQAAEFWNAFPNFIGSHDLKSYTRSNGVRHTIIEIERFSTGKTRYRITGEL